MISSGYASLDAQVNAFTLGHRLLRAQLLDGWLAPPLPTLAAEHVLPAVERIASGLPLIERSDDVSANDERVLLIGQRLGGRDWRNPPRPLEAADATLLEAVGHARMVFAFIPAMPAELVGWPGLVAGHHSYVDLRPPRGQVDMSRRVDELVWTIEQLALSRPVRIDERLRRSYAFCETASWIGLAGVRGPGLVPGEETR